MNGTVRVDEFLDVTAQCIRACERCATECGASGDAERARCAALARDCADVARLSEALTLRGSPYAAEVCALHEKLCRACAEMCARFAHACCRECREACLACAARCHASAA